MKKREVVVSKLPRLLDEKGDRVVSRVKQEMKNKVNINTIMRRAINGEMPPAWMTSKTPYYGDFTRGPVTIQDAFDVVERAEESFKALPIEFRRALNHDPRNLLSAPKELYERFGLLKKPEGEEAANAAPQSPVGQRVQGDSGLPGKAPAGAKKGVQKTPPEPKGEE